MNVQLAQRFGLIGVGWCVSKTIAKSKYITKSRHTPMAAKRPKVPTQEDPSKPLIHLQMHAVHTQVMHMENRDARGMVTRDNVLVQATDTGKRDRPCRWNRDARLSSDAKKRPRTTGLGRHQ